MRDRRVSTPGVYVDFASQYPTVFVLQGLWRFMIAERIGWQEDDPRAFKRYSTALTSTRC